MKYDPKNYMYRGQKVIVIKHVPEAISKYNYLIVHHEPSGVIGVSTTWIESPEINLTKIIPKEIYVNVFRYPTGLIVVSEGYTSEIEALENLTWIEPEALHQGTYLVAWRE